jgi:hypothetical protein
MKSYTQIADQIWNKLNAEKSGARAITKSDLASSLQPGNSLAIMLDGIAGTDGVLRGQLEATLYMKASGATNYSREEAVRTGLQTKATASQANRTASSFNTLAQTSRSGAAGVTASNDLAASMSDLTNSIDALTGVVKASSGVSSFITTTAGIGNGLIGKAMGMIGLGSLLPGRAEGGPTQGNNAYVVGEKGPELFVPSQNGTVVPNHKLNFAGFRANGGDVSTQFATQLITGLGGQATPDALDAIKTWMRFEGGGGGKATGLGANSAMFNPLNTSLKLPGSTPMSEKNKLVQSYTSMDQGLQATITTLTGKGADSRGYTAIVNALKSGGSKEEILNAINASAWVNGDGKASNYKFTGAKTVTDEGGQQFSGLSGVMNTSSGESYADMIKKSNPQAAAMWGTGGGGETNNNFGGVTIVIQGAKDAKATANEVSKVLTDGTLLKSARGN